MIISLIKLKTSHFPLFYKWWNDDEIRKLTSEKDGPIEPKEVDKILKRHLEDSDKFDFIITADKKPIGHILIQKKPRKKHFEIYIAIGEKKFWGQGIGAISMNKAIKWFFKKFPGENLIQLEVLTNNEHAIQCYKKVGFTTIKTVHRKKYSDTYLMIFKKKK
ncbi:MAG: GNAT family N-acetyltransferase [Patescibacteria group bacterium]|jgi:regulator of nucleoside diphosphate kinase